MSFLSPCPAFTTSYRDLWRLTFLERRPVHRTHRRHCRVPASYPRPSQISRYSFGPRCASSAPLILPPSAIEALSHPLAIIPQAVSRPVPITYRRLRRARSIDAIVPLPSTHPAGPSPLSVSRSCQVEFPKDPFATHRAQLAPRSCPDSQE